MADNFSGQKPPKNYLIESILVTLFCCLPLGIVGIINATKVESKFHAGDIEGAEQAAAEAKKWTTYGAIGGAIVIVIYIIFMVVGGAAALMGGG
ncbi:MAG: CD225/dispanin family protein [Bernardetiaceae bacterium]|jgi:hypothetical protein|nr:CD225/dispanin family protein [Bernardetiaceae bacterium]